MKHGTPSTKIGHEMAHTILGHGVGIVSLYASCETVKIQYCILRHVDRRSKSA